LRVASSQRGISLVELVIFIAVAGAAVAGVLSVMNLTTRTGADPMIRKQALAVAESLLEEIALKDFANPPGGFSGPPTPANRPLFDDVNDYDGFVMGPGIVDLTNTVIPRLESYSVSVSVTPFVLAGADARRIVVTVTDPQGATVTLSGFRTNDG
jgi:MSHA pilin protein MshD